VFETLTKEWGAPQPKRSRSRRKTQAAVEVETA